MSTVTAQSREQDPAPLFVAIIEDRQEDRFFLSLAIKDAFAGAEVIEFAYAADALGYLRSPNRPKFDFLLVDISMPQMSGFEFADAYEQLYPELKGRARLYITSSSIDPSDRVRAERHVAVSGFLEKPVSVEVLRRLVEDDGHATRL